MTKRQRRPPRHAPDPGGDDMTRTEFVRQRDGEAAVEPYRKLMRQAYRGAVLRLRTKKHPYRRPWIEGYLEFKR